MFYFTCKYCKQKISVDSIYKKAIHISNCPSNKKANKSQKLVKSFLPKKSTIKFKKKSTRNRDDVEPSFAEKFVIKHFDELKITNYRREYKISGFFGDFAFMKERVILEIDGKQHKLAKAIEYDKIRDAVISSKRWKVVRIDWCRNQKVMKRNLDSFIEKYLYIGK